MPELLSPGVYIQEVAFGPEPIEGVSTSTAGFVGETQRGLVEGQPTLVTSFPDFQRKFGGFVTGMDLAYAVRGFFDNGGRRAYIVRVSSETSDNASANVENGYDVALLSSEAEHPSPAEKFTLRVASVVGVQIGQEVAVISKSGNVVGTADITKINATMSSLDLQGTLSEPITPASHAVRYVDQPLSPSETQIAFTARDPGKFGDRVRVRLTPVYLANATITSIGASGGGEAEFFVSPIDPFVVDTIVELETNDSAQDRAYCQVRAVDAASNKVTVDSTEITATYSAGDFIRVTGWQLEVFFDASLVETITGISSYNDGPDGLPSRLDAASQWVRVDSASLAIGINQVFFSGETVFPFFPAGDPVTLDGGTDVPPDASEVIGRDVTPRRGLKALESQNGVNIIAAPGFNGTTGKTYAGVVGELIAQAERRKDRFAVFESEDPRNDSPPDIGEVLTQRGLYNSRYAAMYHPWVEVLDPLTSQPLIVPPTGHILGCYARTDNDRGVFKAPANVVIQNILGFDQTITEGEQDILNPAGVDVLRQLDGLGLVIWGARTISAESLWKYVSVRRLFIFIEQSIIIGTRFAVFEPNDERLWKRLHDAVTNFLTTQWRAGALFGAKPDEAFFVKVDETTTTQDDRDNGRVNIVVGIAPVKPAEFVVFQIGQAPQSVIIAEQG